jgi:hypothetical protein
VIIVQRVFKKAVQSGKVAKPTLMTNEDYIRRRHTVQRLLSAHASSAAEGLQ